MNDRNATIGKSRRCSLPAISLLLICALTGSFNFFSTPFSLWVARVASLPEEEETYAKDRSALVSAVQPSRRGVVRPKSTQWTKQDRFRSVEAACYTSSLAPVCHRLLTGAGIFQQC